MGGAQLPAGRQPVAARAGTRRFAPSLPTVAAAVGFVVLALAVVYLVLAGLVHQLTPGQCPSCGIPDRGLRRGGGGRGAPPAAEIAPPGHSPGPFSGGNGGHPRIPPRAGHPAPPPPPA